MKKIKAIFYTSIVISIAIFLYIFTNILFSKDKNDKDNKNDKNVFSIKSLLIASFCGLLISLGISMKKCFDTSQNF